MGMLRRHRKSNDALIDAEARRRVVELTSVPVEPVASRVGVLETQVASAAKKPTREKGRVEDVDNAQYDAS